MPAEDIKPLKLFYCYAREDKALRDELDIHLTSLKRQSLITSWYDGEITPGIPWEKEIKFQLRSAHIVLLLVTPHFIASEYCYSTEMRHAIKRHQEGLAHVIPIILRHTFWQGAPFSKLQMLPTDAKPLAQWKDRDEAFWDITVGIYKVIEELQITLLTPQRVTDNDKYLYLALPDLARAVENLAVYDQATLLNPSNQATHNSMSSALEPLTNLLIKAYRDVQSGNITDPKTIRSIAQIFFNIAHDSQKNSQVRFDGERAATNLLEQARIYETGDST